MFKASALITGILLTGCNTTTPEDTSLNICPETRPMICNMIYDPVCGTTNGGQLRTYASNCVACGDQAVIGYRTGACPDE